MVKVGDVIGSYRLLEALASGSYGRVFRAQHIILGTREAAIKLMLSSFTGKEDSEHFLLISPDFINSNYCYEKEMLRAMERHRAGEAHVIPIILRPAHWERAPFGKLQALPPGARALTLWPNRDEAFVHVAKGIQKVVDDLTRVAAVETTIQRVEDAPRTQKRTQEAEHEG